MHKKTREFDKTCPSPFGLVSTPKYKFQSLPIKRTQNVKPTEMIYVPLIISSFVFL